MRNQRRTKITCSLIVALFTLGCAGCETDRQRGGTAVGAVVGGAAGAAAAEDETTGAVLGAVGGALAGEQIAEATENERSEGDHGNEE